MKKDYEIEQQKGIAQDLLYGGNLDNVVKNNETNDKPSFIDI